MFIMKRNSRSNKKSVYHLPSITLVEKVQYKYSHRVFKSEQLPPTISISFDQSQKSAGIPKLIEQYYRNLKSSRTQQRNTINPISDNSTQSYLKVKRKKKSTNKISIGNKKLNKDKQKKNQQQFIRYRDIEDYQNSQFGYQSLIKEGGNHQSKNNLISRLKGLEKLKNQDDSISRRCISKFFTLRRDDNSTQQKSPVQQSERLNINIESSPNKSNESPKKIKIKLLPLKNIKYKLKDQIGKNMENSIAQQNTDLSGWNNKQEEVHLNSNFPKIAY